MNNHCFRILQVIVWDVTNDMPHIVKTITCHTDMIYSLAINRDGSLIATTSKDRKLRVIEPRSAIVVSVIYHEFLRNNFFQKIMNSEIWNFDKKYVICRRASATAAPNAQRPHFWTMVKY